MRKQKRKAIHKIHVHLYIVKVFERTHRRLVRNILKKYDRDYNGLELVVDDSTHVADYGGYR